MINLRRQQGHRGGESSNGGKTEMDKLIGASSHFGTTLASCVPQSKYMAYKEKGPCPFHSCYLSIILTQEVSSSSKETLHGLSAQDSWRERAEAQLGLTSGTGLSWFSGIFSQAC